MVEIFKLKGSFYDGNVYLIKAKEAMLVDAGTDARAVINQVKRIASNLKYIVLTHYHYDHSLAAGEVAAATNAEILIHEEDSELLQDVVLTMTPLLEAEKMEIKPSLLKGGETLDLGNYSIEVIHTPGHSQGSICLYDLARLFSGDTVLPQGNFGSVTMMGAEPRTLVNSIEKLSKLKVEVLYPGHGEITDKGVEQQIKTSLRIAKLMFSRYIQ